jgi:agmatine/peptidylarginine deiminase
VFAPREEWISIPLYRRRPRPVNDYLRRVRHVDGISHFCRRGAIFVETIEDDNDPEYTDLEECREKLAEESDARGRRIEILTLNRPQVRLPASDFCSSYLDI